MPIVVGIPDPNANYERVGPTEKDWVVGNDSVSGWASVPAPGDPSDWIYFWLEGPIASASYRCYRESEQPTLWKPLQESGDVFAATGYSHEDEEVDEPGAELGAAERLPPGIYKVEFLCHLDGEDRCLDGIRFNLPSPNTAQSGTVLRVDPRQAVKPWWKFW